METLTHGEIELVPNESYGVKVGAGQQRTNKILPGCASFLVLGRPFSETLLMWM